MAYGNLALDLISKGMHGRLVILRNGRYDNAPTGVFLPKLTKMVTQKQSDSEISDLFVKLGIMKVSVIVPDDYLGNVIGDLNSRRGQIQGQESRPGATQIDALVPLANMFGYATDLRSSTQGRGQYSMEPHSYVEIPKSIADKIIAERGRNTQD